jgi:hypothetical protein
MFALRTAVVITGAATLANPAGSPLVARGRSGTGVVQRGPRVGDLHGKGPRAVRMTSLSLGINSMTSQV